VKQVKIYPLAKVGNPPAQRLLDMTDVMYNGLVKYDETLFISLVRVLNEEPIQPRDAEMMGLLLPLGIEKGKEFRPGAATVALLKAAAAEAQAWLINGLITVGRPWWPGSQWSIPGPLIGLETQAHWEIPNYFDVDARGIAFSTYFCLPEKTGTGSFYLATYNDKSGKPLKGGNTYRLHVPASVPVREFWSVTLYSLETSSFFLDSTRLTLGSLEKGLQKNADGSVDLYIGSKAPAG
jgi:hypothetical protein